MAPNNNQHNNRTDYDDFNYPADYHYDKYDSRSHHHDNDNDDDNVHDPATYYDHNFNYRGPNYDYNRYVPTFNVNEAVLRYAFNLLIGDVTTSGGSITKAQQVYYLKVVLEYNDGGGVLETDVSPFFGYGLAQRSSNDSTTGGSEGDVVSAWTRNPLTGIIINRTASRQYISLKLYFKFNVNDGGTANTVSTNHYHAYCFAEFL